MSKEVVCTSARGIEFRDTEIFHKRTRILDIIEKEFEELQGKRFRE